MTTSLRQSARSRIAVVWLLAGVAVLLALFSGALGLVPFVVEPAGAADPVDCGSTWLRAEGLPSACYTTVDEWAVAAKGGLAGSAAVAISAALLWVRSARRGGSSTRLDVEPSAA